MKAGEVTALLIEGHPEGFKTPEQALERLRELVQGGGQEGRLVWTTLLTWAKRGFVPEAQRVDPVILAALLRAVQGIREKVLKLAPIEEQPAELRDLRGRPVRVDPGDRLDPPRWGEPDPLTAKGLQSLQSLLVEELRETDDGESVYVSSERSMISEGVREQLESVGIYANPTTRKEVAQLLQTVEKRLARLDGRILESFEAIGAEEAASADEFWESLAGEAAEVEEVAQGGLDPKAEGELLRWVANYLRERLDRMDEGRLVGLQVRDLSRAGEVVLR